jgi:hypothetical protein
MSPWLPGSSAPGPSPVVGAGSGWSLSACSSALSPPRGSAAASRAGGFRPAPSALGVCQISLGQARLGCDRLVCRAGRRLGRRVAAGERRGLVRRPCRRCWRRGARWLLRRIRTAGTRRSGGRKRANERMRLCKARQGKARHGTAALMQCKATLTKARLPCDIMRAQRRADRIGRRATGGPWEGGRTHQSCGNMRRVLRRLWLHGKRGPITARGPMRTHPNRGAARTDDGLVVGTRVCPSPSASYLSR